MRKSNDISEESDVENVVRYQYSAKKRIWTDHARKMGNNKQNSKTGKTKDFQSDSQKENQKTGLPYHTVSQKSQWRQYGAFLKEKRRKNYLY